MPNSKKQKITPFQALTILAEKYKDIAPRKYKQIQSIYLSGVTSPASAMILDGLLQDPILKDKYYISYDKQDITNDPVRRYFESTLCLETLHSSLDNLNLKMLKSYNKQLRSRLPQSYKLRFNAVSNGESYLFPKKENTVAGEYAEAIKVINDPNSYTTLTPREVPGLKREDLPEKRFRERKEKMKLLVENSYIAADTIRYQDRVDKKNNKNPAYPIAIYSDPQNVYGEQRGQKRKEGQITEFSPESKKGRISPGSAAKGIMKSHMALPADDPLRTEAVDYLRSTDRTTFIPGRAQPEQSFNTQVTPFVNSISGTMLANLRMMAAIYKQDKNLTYSQEQNPKAQANAEEQLQLYFKNFVSYMLYEIGGHSLREYMSVLALPEVQAEFKDLPGFNELTLEKLFKDTNKEAFDLALKATCAYNNTIVRKNSLNEEITQDKEMLKRHEELPSSVITEDELTKNIRSRLKPPTLKKSVKMGPRGFYDNLGNYVESPREKELREMLLYKDTDEGKWLLSIIEKQLPEGLSIESEQKDTLMVQLKKDLTSFNEYFKKNDNKLSAEVMEEIKEKALNIMASKYIATDAKDNIVLDFNPTQKASKLLKNMLKSRRVNLEIIKNEPKLPKKSSSAGDVQVTVKKVPSFPGPKLRDKLIYLGAGEILSRFNEEQQKELIIKLKDDLEKLCKVPAPGTNYTPFVNLKSTKIQSNDDKRLKHPELQALQKALALMASNYIVKDKKGIESLDLSRQLNAKSVLYQVNKIQKQNLSFIEDETVFRPLKKAYNEMKASESKVNDQINASKMKFTDKIKLAALGKVASIFGKGSRGR